MKNITLVCVEDTNGAITCQVQENPHILFPANAGDDIKKMLRKAIEAIENGMHTDMFEVWSSRDTDMKFLLPLYMKDGLPPHFIVKGAELFKASVHDPNHFTVLFSELTSQLEPGESLAEALKEMEKKTWTETFTRAQIFGWH